MKALRRLRWRVLAYVGSWLLLLAVLLPREPSNLHSDDAHDASYVYGAQWALVFLIVTTVAVVSVVVIEQSVGRRATKDRRH